MTCGPSGLTHAVIRVGARGSSLLTAFFQIPRVHEALTKDLSPYRLEICRNWAQGTLPQHGESQISLAL